MTVAGRIPGLTVVGYAMWTAAGPDGPSTVATMRAGVLAAASACLHDSTSGENLTAFRVTAKQWWEGATFLPQLIAPVVEGCRALIAGLEPMRPRAADVPVLINVAPPDRPGRDPSLEQIVRGGLPALLSDGLAQGSVIASGGRAGIPQLLARVADLDVPVAIVIGAESFLRQVIVEHYNSRGRLLSGANSNGFIAGEAAAAVMVERGPAPRNGTDRNGSWQGARSRWRQQGRANDGRGADRRHARGADKRPDRIP